MKLHRGPFFLIVEGLLRALLIYSFLLSGMIIPPAEVQAAWPAADDAADKAYTNSTGTTPATAVLTNGSNGGSGWQEWQLTPAVNHPTAGFTNRSSTINGIAPVIDTGAGFAWGMYADAGKTNLALRLFTNNVPMNVGQQLAVEMAPGLIGPNGMNGVELVNAETNALLRLFFTHDLATGTYHITDGSGTAKPYPSAYGFTNGFQFVFALTNADSGVLLLDDGAIQTNHPVTLIHAVGGQQIVGARLFGYGTGKGVTNFFNSLRLGCIDFPTCTLPPSMNVSSNYTFTGAVGYSNLWQVIDVNGCGVTPVPADATNNPTLTVQSPVGCKQYDLVLTVLSNGCSSICTSHVSVVNRRRQLFGCTGGAITSGDVAICSNATTTIKATLAGIGPWDVTWQDDAGATKTNFTQNNVVSAVASRLVSPNSTITYTLAGLIDNGGGPCTALPVDLTGSATVTVNPRPTVVVTGTASICSNSSATITATLTGTGPYNLTWSDGFIQTGVVSPATRSVTPSANTTYSLTAVIDTSSGCAALPSVLLSSSAAITLKTLPTAVVSATGLTTICSNATTTIQAVLTGAGPYNLIWSDGSIQSGVAGPIVSHSVTPSATTTYTLTSVTDNNGCSALPAGLTGSAIVTVTPLPTALVSGTTSICTGSTATIQAVLTGTGPWDVTWTPVGGGDTGFVQRAVQTSPATRIVSPSQTTTYTVTALTDTDSGCQITSLLYPKLLRGNAVVTVTPLPPANITFTTSYVCTGSVGTAYASALKGASYSWSFDGGASLLGQATNGVTFLSSVSNSLTAFVQVTDANGCISSNGMATLPVYATVSTVPSNITFRAYVYDPFHIDFTTQSQPYDVQIHNTTGHSIVLSNIVVAPYPASANPADFVILSDPCSHQVIANGGSCTIQVQFTPGDYGTRTATLNIPWIDNEHGLGLVSCANPLTVAMTGAGKHCSNMAPLPPGTDGYAMWTLGDVPLGFTGGQTITLTNNGNLTSTLAGDTTEIVLGTPLGQLNVTNQDLIYNADSLYITDDSSGGAFFITGGTGIKWDEHTIGVWPNGWGASADIGQGATNKVGEISSFPITIGFAPSTNLPTGKYQATVHLVGDFCDTNGGNHEITFQVKAQATAPILTVVEPTPPNPLVFPGTVVNFTTGPERVVIQNTGDGPLRNVKFQIVSTNAEDFTIVADSCDPSFVGPTSDTAESGTPIQPGDLCGVTIDFKPGVTGPRTATLLINGWATNTLPYPDLVGQLPPNGYALPSPYFVSVPMHGNGSLGVASIGISPSSLNFPNTARFGTSVSQMITVTNGGTINLVISTNLFNFSNNGRGTNVFSGGNGTNDFAVTSTTCAGLPISIAPGTSCGINVVFNPTNTGARSTWLQIFSNSGTNVPFAMNATNSVLVTGYSTAPTLTPVPSQLDFGTNAVGVESAPLVVAVENTGNGPLLLNNVSQASIVGTNAADFLYYGDTCSGNPVAPGNNCGITVRFKPSLTNSETATLLLISNITDGNGQPVTNAIPLTGVGAANAPAIGFTPTSLLFGDQPLGTTSAPPISVAITNGGSAAMLITNITSSDGEFIVTPAAGALNTLILPSASVTVNVQFAPTNTGTRAGNINLYWNNGSPTPTAVPVLGSGTAPGLTPLPGSVTFTNTAQPIGVTSAAQLVLLHNSGSAPLTITGVTVVGTNTADFAASLAGCGNVPPGGDCLLSVTFTPGATNGLRTAALRIASNATNAPPVDIPVFGIGTNNAPSLGLIPASLNFNNVDLGTTSVVQSVTVTNSGTAALVITNIDLSVTGHFVVTSPNCLNVPIAPGALCTLNVAFAPTNSGAHASVVRLWNNTSVNPAPVTVSGVGAAPVITPVPNTVVFGNVPVSATSTGQTIQVQNTGLAPLTLSSVTVIGPGSNNFLATSVGCTTVPPGGNCSVTIVFAPTAVGVTNATLVLAGNADDSASVTLSGTGAASAPVLRFNPTLLPTFGNVSLGTTSAVQAVTVTNAGTAALVISNVTLAGNNPGDFILNPANTCVGVSILPGGTCTISVEFTPTVSGNRGATVVVTNNAGIPQSFPVKGAGIAPVILPSPTSIDFGTQTVAVATAPQWVVTKNTGDGPLTITSITFISTNAPDFALVENNCLGSSIQPGDTCLLGITFTPGAALPRTGTLVIDSTATNGEQRIHLSGVGSAITNGPAIDWTPTNLNFPNTTVGATSVVQSVTVTNHNTAPLVITNVDLSVAGEFIVGTVGCLNTPLVPGAICTLNVAFTPTNSGAHASFVRIWNNTGLNPAQIPVNGIGAAPTITPQPATLAFGNQPVSVTSTALIVQVQNTGIVPLSLSSATVTGPNAADFTATPIGCATVPPGGSCGVSVVFTPGAAAAETATLVLTGNADNSPVNVPLSGTGVPSAPIVVFNPALLPTFGNVVVGSTSAVQSVTVTNAGTSSLLISTVALAGNNPGDFIVDNTCVGVSILPGGTCTINIKFKPTVGGNRGATVVVTDNAAGSPHSFPVKGAGVAPLVLALPSSISFGTQTVNVASAPQWVQVYNTGNGPLTIANLSVISTNAPDFTIVSSTCLGSPIQPGDSCSIGVSFKPGAALARTATLVIDSDGTNGQQRVHLSGMGANAGAALGVNPTSLTFGDITLGTTSAVQSVTVTNGGTASLIISSVGFAGGNAGEFVVLNSTCVGAGILPGNSCTILVGFAPTGSAARVSNLQLLSNSGNGTNLVPVSGSGVRSVLSLSANALDFGTNLVGTTSSAQSVTITNSGTGPLVVQNLTISGLNPGDFSLVSFASLSNAILPGKTAQISLNFHTDVALPRSAVVTIFANAANSPQSITLQGVGKQFFCPTITVAPATLPAAGSSVNYAQAITASGGVAPYTYQITSGTLPAGLALTNGLLTGTLLQTNTSTFTVQATDANGCGGSQTYTVTVGCSVLTIAPATATLPAATNTVAYLQRLSLTTPSGQTVGGYQTVSDNQATSIPASATVPTTVDVPINVAGVNGVITNLAVSLYLIYGDGLHDLDLSLLAPDGTRVQLYRFAGHVSSNGWYQYFGTACNPESARTVFTDLAPTTIVPGQAAYSGNYRPLTPLAALNGKSGGAVNGTWTLRLTDASNIDLDSALYCWSLSFGTISCSSFAISSGTLPPGVNLASDGTLAGTPSATGTYTFTVTAKDCAGCTASQTYSVTVSAAAPAISFNPAPLPAFGDVSVGATSSLQSVTVQNTGVGSLVITNLGVAGANPNDFILDTSVCQGAVIAPGSTCQINVRFKPTASGDRSATILVYDNSTGNPHSFAVAGAGITPMILVVPTNLNFNTQTVAMVTAPLYLQVFNNGNGPLTITNLTLVGTNATDFTILPNACLGTPLQPGDSCSVGIRFTPGATFARTGTLLIDSNGTNGQQRVALRGVGVIPAGAAIVVVTPPAVDFGTELVGSATSSKPVYLSNVGNTALTVTDVEIGGLNPGDYQIVGNGCGQILPGQICQIFVNFQPQVALPRSGTLFINSTATNGQQQVALSGIGSAAKGVLTLSASNLDFGIQTNSVATVKRSVTVGNAGNAALLITNVTLTGSGVAAFTVVSNTCNGTFLNPFATCQIAVTYTPAVDGIQTAAMQIGTVPGGLTNITLVAGRYFDGSGTTNCPGAAITITPAAFGIFRTGVAVAQQLSAAGGAAPYRFAVASGALPTGLTLSAAGALTGSITIAGNYSFTLRVVDQFGCTATQAYTINALCPLLDVLPQILTNGFVGAPYSQPVALSAGPGPFVYSLVAGSLPPGLSFTNTANGYLTGTPTAGGSYTFTVRIANANGCYGQQVYTVTIGCSALVMTTGLLPNAQVGVSYSQQFTAANGTLPLVFSQTAGALPIGLTLSNSGLLSGIPTGGSGAFTITATDANGCAASQDYVLTVSIGPPVFVLTAPTIQSVTVNQPVVQQLTASGGTGPVTFAVVDGTLPSGLTLSANGDLTGVATDLGTAVVTIQAQDSAGHTARQSVTLNVVTAPCALILTPVNLRNGTVGQSYSTQLSAAGGTSASTTYAVFSNTLPTGLTLSAAGLLAGTPTTEGSADFWVRAQNGNCSISNHYAITINATGSGGPTVINKVLVTNAAGVVTLKVSGTAGIAVSQVDPNTSRIGQVTVTGTDAHTVLSITVKKANGNSDGLVEIGTITTDSDLASLAGTPVNIVDGALSIAGKVGSLTLNSMNTATLTAGGAIGSVTIKNFASSHVTAPQISKVNLGTVTTNNAGVAFGIQAPAINAVTVKAPKGFKWKKTGAADQALGDFHVQKQ